MTRDSFKQRDALRQALATSDGDTARTCLLTALNFVPGVGGAFATLLEEVLPERKLERVCEFLRGFAVEFDKLCNATAGMRETIADSIAKNEELGLKIEHVLHQVAQTTNEVKIAAYEAALVHSCDRNAPSQDEQDFFISKLDSFTPIHLAIIKIVLQGQGVGPNVLGFVRGLQDDILDLAYRDLVDTQMIRHDSDARHSLKGPAREPDHYPFTRLGKRFADFISL